MTEAIAKAITSLERQAAEQQAIINTLTAEIKNDVDGPRASLFQIGTQAQWLTADELTVLGEMIARETKALNEKITAIQAATRHRDMLNLTIEQFRAGEAS